MTSGLLHMPYSLKVRPAMVKCMSTHSFCTHTKELSCWKLDFPTDVASWYLRPSIFQHSFKFLIMHISISWSIGVSSSDVIHVFGLEGFFHLLCCVPRKLPKQVYCGVVESSLTVLPHDMFTPVLYWAWPILHCVLEWSYLFLYWLLLVVFFSGWFEVTSFWCPSSISLSGHKRTSGYHCCAALALCLSLVLHNYTESYLFYQQGDFQVLLSLE